MASVDLPSIGCEMEFDMVVNMACGDRFSPQLWGRDDCRIP